MERRIQNLYEDCRIPTIYSIVVTVSCYLSIRPIMSQVGWGVAILLFVLSYISASIVRKSYSLFTEHVKSIAIKILAFVLFVYFNFSLYGMVFLETFYLDDFQFSRVLFIPLALIWTIPVYLFVFYVMIVLFEMPMVRGRRVTCIVKVLAFFFLMVNYLIWLYAFNPCISSSDSSYLFDQAHQMRVVQMANWHPPFYAIVMSFLLKICDSATFIVVLQCIAFSVLVTSIVRYLREKGCRVQLLVLLYLFWGFSFNNTLQMITLWKDIPYMISILWLTFLLAQYVVEKGKVSLIWHIKCVLALVLTAFFRQNGILPALVTTIILLVVFLHTKRYFSLITCASFFLIAAIIIGPVYSYYNIINYPGLKYFAMANDIVGVYYDSDDKSVLSEEIIDIVDEITNGKPETFDYDAYYTNYNDGALGHYSIVGFLNVYFKTFINHPGSMTLNFLRRNSVLWSIAKPLGETPGDVNHMYEYHHDEMKYQYPYRVPNKMTDILSELSDLLTDNSIIFIFAWRVGAFFVLLLFSAFILICEDRRNVLLIYVPAVFNAVGLCASSGWSDYRYFWPIAVIALFIFPVCNIVLNRDLTN